MFKTRANKDGNVVTRNTDGNVVTRKADVSTCLYVLTTIIDDNEYIIMTMRGKDVLSQTRRVLN